jgi:cell division septum initiation protein DivIVA
MEQIEDPSSRIARLEEEIAALEESAERCGKVMLAAQVAVGAGIVGLAAILLGLVRLGGMGFVFAVAAALIGIVLYGSNKSTRDVLRAQAAEKRAERDRLIDRLAPRTVH